MRWVFYAIDRFTSIQLSMKELFFSWSQVQTQPCFLLMLTAPSSLTRSTTCQSCQKEKLTVARGFPFLNNLCAWINPLSGQIWEVMIQTPANLLDTKWNETAACVSATSSLWVLFNTHNMHPRCQASTSAFAKLMTKWEVQMKTVCRGTTRLFSLKEVFNPPVWICLSCGLTAAHMYLLR